MRVTEGHAAAKNQPAKVGIGAWPAG